MARTRISTIVETLAGAETLAGRRRADRPRGAAGFTLLELLVVLAIIALVAAIGIPRLVTPSALSEGPRAAREVAAAMRETRMHAIRTNRAAELVVDVAAREITLPTGERLSLPAGFALSLYTSDDLLFDGARGAVRFYPDGSSTGGHLDLKQEDAGEADEIRVSIDWLTGRVDVRP